MSKKKNYEIKLKTKLPKLIEEIKNGDDLAKDQFAVLVYPYVRLLLCKFNKSISDPDSIANWITYKIIASIDKIDVKKPIIGYIVTTTNNYSIDQIISSKRLKRACKIVDMPKDIIDPKSISKIDNFFSDTEQEILTSYSEGYSLEEISAITGAPLQEVEQVIQSANDYFG